MAFYGTTGKLVGALVFKGTWNANTNSPALASGVGTQGDLYVVSVAGNTTLDGNTNWHVGDFVTFDGSAWDKVDNFAYVTSVNGQVGTVVLTTTNVAEGTSLYFTNARAIAAVLTGYTSGAGTVAATDTILQAIQKLNGNDALRALLTGAAFTGTVTITPASGFEALTLTATPAANGAASTINYTKPASANEGGNAIQINVTASGATTGRYGGGLRVDLSGNAGVSGGPTCATFNNSATSTGTDFFNNSGNLGVLAQAYGNGTGHNAGVVGFASDGAIGYGVIGVATSGSNSAKKFIGMYGGASSKNSAAAYVAGYFKLTTGTAPANPDPGSLKAVIAGDNGATGVDLLNLFSNGASALRVNSIGSILASVDGGIDIGASGANRPNNVYYAGQLVVPNGANPAAPDIYFAGSTTDHVGFLGGAGYTVSFAARNEVVLQFFSSGHTGRINWVDASAGTTAYIGTSNNGRLDLVTDPAANSITFTTAGASAGGIGSAGWELADNFILQWHNDNAGDIGINATTKRPRNLYLGTDAIIGNGIQIKSKSNGRIGTATLVGGTVTVSNTSVTASTVIMLTIQTPGGTLGSVYVASRVNGTSFTINSTSVIDTSVVGYVLIEPY